MTGGDGKQQEARTVATVIAEWRAYHSDDDAQLASAINYYIATEVTPGEIQRATQPSTQPSESGWLIERGGLCFGFCDRKLAWVTFTNDQTWRFARRSDAIRFIEAYGEDFGLHDVMVTEHRWG
jgi:hypothetical protein